MVYEENNNIMKAFFQGRIGNDIPESKLVELGDGKGVGSTFGSYNQYVKKLSEQRNKGNGAISIGKSVITDKEIFLMSNPTDKFAMGDVPHILIMYDNIINEISLKTIWENSDGDHILEQYYNIPSPYSMGYYWWDSYGVHFTGPEDLEEGEYKVGITSEEIISREQTIGEKKDNIRKLSVSIEFSIVDSS